MLKQSHFLSFKTNFRIFFKVFYLRLLFCNLANEILSIKYHQKFLYSHKSSMKNDRFGNVRKTHLICQRPFSLMG